MGKYISNKQYFDEKNKLIEHIIELIRSSSDTSEAADKVGALLGSYKEIIK